MQHSSRAKEPLDLSIGGYRVPPTRRAVTVGNEAPPAGLASKVPDGSDPSTLLAFADAQQRYDAVIVGTWPPNAPGRARLPLVTRSRHPRLGPQ